MLDIGVLTVVGSSLPPLLEKSTVVSRGPYCCLWLLMWRLRAPPALSSAVLGSRGCETVLSYQEVLSPCEHSCMFVGVICTTSDTQRKAGGQSLRHRLTSSRGLDDLTQAHKPELSSALNCHQVELGDVI